MFRLFIPGTIPCFRNPDGSLNLAKAIHYFQKTQYHALMPKATAHYNLGLALFLNKRPEEAHREMELAGDHCQTSCLNIVQTLAWMKCISSTISSFCGLVEGTKWKNLKQPPQQNSRLFDIGALEGISKYNVLVYYYKEGVIYEWGNVRFWANKEQQNKISLLNRRLLGIFDG